MWQIQEANPLSHNMGRLLTQIALDSQSVDIARLKSPLLKGGIRLTPLFLSFTPVVLGTYLLPDKAPTKSPISTRSHAFREQARSLCPCWPGRRRTSCTQAQQRWRIRWFWRLWLRRRFKRRIQRRHHSPIRPHVSGRNPTAKKARARLTSIQQS